MKINVDHEIRHDPEPDDADTITINARVFVGEDDYLPFSTTSFAKEFIDDENDGCRSKEELEYFLMEAVNDNDVILDAMLKLIVRVDEITCESSNEYSPGCALEVRLDFIPDYLIVDEDSQIQEAAQASFDEASNIRVRPASKLAIKNLSRKICKKKKIVKTGTRDKEIYNMICSTDDQKCTICLEEFHNGARLVTLPCGHDFDDDCIVKWFERSHVCPLCRYELQCEESMN
ncbi:unnamed protein product [Microthlaspi erraticum]|uniref:RING-type E3 ubiquitin transferase n=1 Tax=Microthlaspi erraticum TaxID=1685480 RepID=A0A6D2HG24_9BRAS|nr:unnamed protein product [Microthlaspi erraticum]